MRPLLKWTAKTIGMAIVVSTLLVGMLVIGTMIGQWIQTDKRPYIIITTNPDQYESVK